MSKIPDDIITDILLWVPAKSIARFKYVCKSWYKLLTGTFFVQSHIEHQSRRNKFHLMFIPWNLDVLYSTNNNTNTTLSSSMPLPSDIDIFEIDYPFKYDGGRFYILGSCNGLICFEPYDNTICLWNPCTGEFRKIPHPPALEIDKEDIIYYGFGYDSKIEDYKLVRIVQFKYYKTNPSIVQVYTLGLNSWKSIETYFPYLLFIYTNDIAIFVKGALHWKAYKSHGQEVIVSFDLGDETFHEHSLHNDGDRVVCTLGAFEGDLCLALKFVDEGMVEIWVMKGVSKSWSRLSTISHVFDIEYSMEPMIFLPNGEILIETYLVGKWDTLISYHMKQGRANTIKIHGNSERLAAAIKYVESPISLI